MIHKRLYEKFLVRDAKDFVPSFKISTEKHCTLKIRSLGGTEVVFMTFVQKASFYIKGEVFKSLLCTWPSFADCVVGFKDLMIIALQNGIAAIHPQL